MSSTKQKKRSARSPLKRAVIALREKLGHTQESFARLLNVSTVTVGKWEGPSGHEPVDIMLARFAQMAREAGREDLEQVFNAELRGIGEARSQKANDILNEIERWHKINAYLKELGQIDAAVRAAKGLPTAKAAIEPMYDLLVEFQKTLAAAQAWSWRNR
jgi:transcriptional regulator with XRE-family HTH domain